MLYHKKGCAPKDWNVSDKHKFIFEINRPYKAFLFVNWRTRGKYLLLLPWRL